jgi:membrane-bound lytic murein transglycosylase D
MNFTWKTLSNSRAVVKSDENSSETRTTTRSATKYYKKKRGDNLG